ncbi:hypothetical protein [Nocardia salmonicida]|uniref:hypothetical protein n=1 Tax=Nocardia salmonicida TaxID=53431 RepID=UPI003CEDF749
MNLDLSCPQCERVDLVQSVPATMSEGTRSGYSTGMHSGVGIAPSGLVPVIGTSSQEFSHTTELARSLAWRPTVPVGGRHTFFGVVLSIFFLVMFAASCTAVSMEPPQGNPIEILVSLVGFFLFPIMLAIPLYFLISGAFKRARRQARIHAGSGVAYGLWQNSFYCHRCGTAFWPQRTFPEVPYRVALTPSQFRWHVWNAGGYAKL